MVVYNQASFKTYIEAVRCDIVTRGAHSAVRYHILDRGHSEHSTWSTGHRSMCKRSEGAETAFESSDELEDSPKMSATSGAAAIMHDASKPSSPGFDNEVAGPVKSENDNMLAVVKSAAAHRPAPPPTQSQQTSRQNEYVPSPQVSSPLSSTLAHALSHEILPLEARPKP